MDKSPVAALSVVGCKNTSGVLMVCKVVLLLTMFPPRLIELPLRTNGPAPATN